MKKEKLFFIFILGLLTLYFSKEVYFSANYESGEMGNKINVLSGSAKNERRIDGHGNYSHHSKSLIKSIETDEFSGFLMKMYSAIPTIDELRNLSLEESHNYPNPLIETGRNMGLLVDLIKGNKDYLKEAIGFYSKCSKRDRFPKSVRALCLANLLKYSKGSDYHPDLSLYPHRVLEMVKIMESV